MDISRYILGPDGTPLPEPDAGRWCVWMAAHARRRGRMTQQDRTVVVTRFTGVDLEGNDPPLLWETLVVGGGSDGWKKRHATAGDADRFHSYAVLMAFGGFGAG